MQTNYAHHGRHGSRGAHTVGGSHSAGGTHNAQGAHGAHGASAADRQPPRRQRRRGSTAAIGLLVVLVAVVAAVGWVVREPLEGLLNPERTQAPSAVQTGAVGDITAGTSSMSVNPSDVTSAPSGTPRYETEIQAAQLVDQETPLFGSYEDVQFHVAVPIDSLTELLLHQASYGWALQISTPLPEASNEEAMSAGGTGRSEVQPAGDAYLDGSVLRVWRSGRTMAMDTAVDCGAAAGTPVLSPVSGTVVLIEQYQLYGESTDYQIHIQPYGRPDIDVVLIHIVDPSVVAGDQVVGGYTQIGGVRDLSALMGLQLGEYTAEDDPGNHTHICVNASDYPGYFGLVGAARVDENGNVAQAATITADTPVDQVVAARQAAAEAAGTTDITLEYLKTAAK